MSVAVGLATLRNPNHSVLTKPRCSPPMALCAPSSLQLQSLLRHRIRRVSLPSPSLVSPIGFGTGFPLLHRGFLSYPSAVSFSASPEESKQTDVGVEGEKDDLGPDVAEAQEAWQQALASFKEQASKMQSVSHEAYKVHSEKAMIILKETSEQLRIQAEKAKEELGAIAKDIGEEGREYISTAAENSPEPVKEIVETLSSSANDLDDVSKFRDFHIGIPYGLLLSVGGFLSFMLTGSISAIRFGIILGGTLLALSISSLRSQKKGESYPLAVKGQADIVKNLLAAATSTIAAIIFLRELGLFSQRSSLLSLSNVAISGAVVAFYVYRLAVDRKKKGGADLVQGTED